MTQIKGPDYAWRKSWSEFKAPDAPGAYCLRDKEGKVRERLLSHWNRENSTDEAIWGHGPATFRFELTTHPAELEVLLSLVPLLWHGHTGRDF